MSGDLHEQIAGIFSHGEMAGKVTALEEVLTLIDNAGTKSAARKEICDYIERLQLDIDIKRSRKIEIEEEAL